MTEHALILYAHPSAGSFNAAIRDQTIAQLQDAGIEVRVTDLYARNFQPVLTSEEYQSYQDAPANRIPVAQGVSDLQWADTLIFIYPTWWYGLPAILKGWLDRVLLPEVAFLMPDDHNTNIRPGLTHITKLAVFTTCGASRSLTFLTGAPGKRTILRGLRFLCAKRCKTTFAALYLMDSSTAESRAKHLKRVQARLAKLIR